MPIDSSLFGLFVKWTVSDDPTQAFYTHTGKDTKTQESLILIGRALHFMLQTAYHQSGKLQYSKESGLKFTLAHLHSRL